MYTRVKILISIFIFFAMITTSCSLPKDIHGTLDKIKKEKVLHVGYSNNPPFISIHGSDSSGIEYKLVKEISKSLDASIIFTEETEAVLIDKLEKYELDIMIAGLNSNSPWKSKVGFTNPYLTYNNIDYSIAVPPGENSFLVYLENYILRNKDKIKGWLNER